MGYNVFQSRRELDLKIDALCVCFGVEPRSVNRDSILILARRYVPGFQVGKIKDPPQKRWDDIRLARLSILFSDARPRFGTDRDAVAHIHRLKIAHSLTGRVKLVWLQQLLDKAKRSPLVQMTESDYSSDKQFARMFLIKHTRKAH